MLARDRSSRSDSETSGAASENAAATSLLPRPQGDRLVQFEPEEISADGLSFLFETVGGDLGTLESFAFASYERATTRHYLLSDQELARLLDLVESTSEDLNPGEDEHVTYEDPNKVIYVRYVGSTRGQTAYNRTIEDRRQRKTGIVGEFLGTLLEVAPRAYEHGKTFEQVIIAFFGRDKLLNVQAGGFYASYAPDPSDIEFPKSPTSRFFQNFAQWSKPVPRAMIEQLKHWKDYVADLMGSGSMAERVDCGLLAMRSATYSFQCLSCSIIARGWDGYKNS
ncbi:BQ5605_C009g05600 [Microbotryum silenes-dioicae]|uniref:BQ5605_C009g05600 protein n=1 Tax=Microbotryum silenes-dioicae TaxID=796604 RepID=A0A2X0PF06_9BASI|nr:BQ5605_C009g05600 [Microbotryum silenes-dioicae]